MNKKIAFVFPGQGSQSVGMLDAFGEDQVVKSTLGEASQSLQIDLANMIHAGPAEELALTENTQPVMLASAIAIYRAWLAAGGIVPTMLAGHSLGEYTAYVAAGAIAFQDAVPLVRFRAQAMQSAVPVGTGAMAAIVGMADDAVKKLCEEIQQSTGKIVEAVNFNAPSQVVIAGAKEAIDEACVRAKPAGAKLVAPLAVSAPFHSSLLKPAAQPLGDFLQKITIQEPGIAVVNNVDVTVVTDPIGIRDTLIRQSYSPVRWVEIIQYMSQNGVTHIVECGPGKVLTGLIKRINSELKVFNIFDPSSIAQVIQELH
jgi:[acyl-carrier-protein] S-malonyltransferase